MFWELDYAAMDFSVNEPVEIQVIKPHSALDSLGRDYTRELTEIDTLYHKSYATGDYTTVKYPAIAPSDGMNQTVLLHSRGYYKRSMEFTGKPQVKLLKTFKQPGAFSEFSRVKYNTVVETLSQASNK